MSGKIKILSPELVSKIAAGEVVEKPASVVKELLDNAIDARASQITIDIQEGGIKKILIVDNGEGMSKEDLELALKPHATSKLSSEEDLLNIKKYGFRGEALSSIAAVSKITLKSRLSKNSMGTEIKEEGGKVTSITEVGVPMGTSILVEDLFYNVPARKSFLKSPQSEYRSVLAVINAHALANPSVGYTFFHNNRQVYALPKDHHLEDRARILFGADFYDKLIPVFFEHPHLEIFGYIGKPELATERKKNQYTFVNKRPVTDKIISSSIKGAYGALIPASSYPQYILFIDVPTNIVDVNIHPRKEEVKFSNSQLIFNSVKETVKKSLSKINLTPGAKTKPKSPFASSPPPFGNFGAPFTAPFSGAATPGTKSPFGSANPLARNAFKKPQAQPMTSPLGGFGTSKPSPFNTPNAIRQKQPSSFANPFWNDPYKPTNQTSQTDSQLHGKDHKKILQVHNLYLIVESKDGILVYDQHAVHERILYEQLIKIHKNQKDQGNIQPLLTPIVVNLSYDEIEIMKENLGEFEKTGFKIEDFGGNSYKISEIPGALVNKDIKTIIHEILGDLEHNNKIKDTDSHTNKLLTYLACRSAYKAGDIIPAQEAQELIKQLDQTNIEYTCPHGRPVKIEFTLDELAKMFKRK